MLAYACIALAFSSTSAATDGDLKKVQGAWKRVSVTSDGRDYPEAAAQQQLIIKGDSYTIKAKDHKDQEGTFRLDPSKMPKEIDIIPSTGPNKGKTLKGIYKLE